MKLTRILILLIITLTVLASGCLVTFPEQNPDPDSSSDEGKPIAELTLSGTTWTATIGTQSIYSGNSLSDALTKSIDKLGAGVINVRNSGSLDKRIYPKAGQTLDFHNNTIGGRESISVYHQNGVTIRNLHMNGTPMHSLNFSGSSQIHLHNIRLEFSGTSGGIRVDNDYKAEKVYTSDLKITGDIYISGTRNDGLETFGIDGIYIDKIVTRNTGGCGVLLNESKNAYIRHIDAAYADWELKRIDGTDGGRYAGFRVANFNGPNVVVDYLKATNCGRGFFSVSGSHGTTIHHLEISGTRNEGIFIQSSQNTVINGGTVTGYSKYGVRLMNGAHTGGDTKNCLVQNLQVRDSRNNSKAVGLEEGRGTWDNQFLNNDLRGSSRDPARELLLRSGSRSISTGNLVTKK